MVVNETTVTGEGISPLMLENKTLSIREVIASKLRERFTIKTPDGLVSEAGVIELNVYLTFNSLGRLPVDFEPVWTTRRGTLPKRLAAHLYKTSKTKLSEEQVSAIGNIARRNSSDAQTYYCDFTNRIDWHAGDFGDYGSCAWGDKAGMKDMVAQNGYAVRFYRESGSGYGRAWVAPISDNRVIVFNAYGLEPITVARILSVHFACGYKRISLANNGSDCGVLWINGGSAYMLGAWAKIESVNAHNLDWEEVEAEPEVECVECGSGLGQSDDCEEYTLDRHGDTVPCCEGCSFNCERCEERFADECQRNINGGAFCRNCHDEIREENERKAQEREEELERLERKVSDCEAIVADLEEQLQSAKDDLESVRDDLADLEKEAE